MDNANHIQKRAVYTARFFFTLVFLINIQCALQFIIVPEQFIGAYELKEISGEIALQGLGIAFLMWNTTYPLFIAKPQRYRALGGIILAQQLIGLTGESMLLASLLPIAANHELLISSIGRFIFFDALGLMLMGASFIYLLYKTNSEKHHNQQN